MAINVFTGWMILFLVGLFVTVIIVSMVRRSRSRKTSSTRSPSARAPAAPKEQVSARVGVAEPASRPPAQAPPQVLCFISYARSERAFAARLSSDLRANRIQVWRDEEAIPPGASWAQEIQQALDACTHVLFVATPRSVESPTVLDEIEFALDKGKVVVPLLLQACELPLRVHRAQWVDFGGDYRDGLRRLLGFFEQR